MKITKEQYKEAEDRANTVKRLMEDEDFSFIREYLTNSKESCKRSLLSGVYDASEETNFGGKLIKIFKPKKRQEDELRGIYKWITQFEADLKYYIDSFERIKE